MSESSLFNRLIGRQRPLAVTVGISLALILAPFGASWLDGAWDQTLRQGNWRPMLLPSIVIVYILVIAPIAARYGTRVLHEFRPLVLVDDDQYNRLVKQATCIRPAGEVIAFGVGVILGLWLNQSWLSEALAFWLGRYWLASLSLMYGLLGWLIYGLITDARLMARLHRQPLQIDILDTKPYESIGRHSLVGALVFAGGVTLGIVFGLDVESITSWRAWLVFLSLALVPVLLFFFNMRDTHRALAAEKERELAAVRQDIRLMYRTLRQRIAGHESLGTFMAELDALTAYEARVQAVPTWPYNTSMLRTLFVTVLTPLLVRAISGILFGG